MTEGQSIKIVIRRIENGFVAYVEKADNMGYAIASSSESYFPDYEGVSAELGNLALRATQLEIDHSGAGAMQAIPY